MSDLAQNSHRSTAKFAFAGVVAALVLLGLALAGGEALLATLAVAGVVAAVVLIAVPQEKLFHLTFTVTILVAGTAHYYFGILYLYWLSYALGAGVFLRFLVTDVPAGRTVRPNQTVPLAILGIFQVLVLVTTLASPISSMQILLGLKVYLPMWLVVVVLAFRPMTESFVERLEKGALLFAAVQAPFVFHQHFTGPDADAVVGTFGNFCNASLMLACIMAILTAIELHQSRRMTTKAAAGHIGLAFLMLLAGEVKAVLFLLPLALAVQQARWLWRNPRKALMAVPLVLVAMGAVVFVYDQLYWSGHGPQSLEEKSIGETFDWTWVNPETGDMGRVTSLAVWVIDRQTDLLHRAIGYGAGATRLDSSAAPGIIGARFAPAAVGVTTASQLLWETGIAGLALHSAIILSGMVTAIRLGRRAKDEKAKGRMMTIAALLAVLFGYQFYKNYETSRAADQLILATLIGVVAAARRDGSFAPAGE
jgi:hypothetical protein